MIHEKYGLINTEFLFVGLAGALPASLPTGVPGALSEALLKVRKT